MKVRAAWALLCASAFSLAHAQTVAFFGPIYDWTPTAAGVAPGVLALNQSGAVPSIYVVEWWYTGTAPKACTFLPMYSASSVKLLACRFRA